MAGNSCLQSGEGQAHEKGDRQVQSTANVKAVPEKYIWMHKRKLLEIRISQQCCTASLKYQDHSVY